MASPSDVAAFHAEYDRHPDDRLRLFGALAGVVPPSVAVLYPGSYVDVAASVWFDDVTYVDRDRRAERFFAETERVVTLVLEKRGAARGEVGERPVISFHPQDYRDPLPVAEGSMDLLVSLYAGLVSRHCTSYVRRGGLLLANPSHGDAAAASFDERYKLAAAITSRDGEYSVRTDRLDEHLVPRRPEQADLDHVLRTGRGIAYTKTAFAYLFRRVS